MTNSPVPYWGCGCFVFCLTLLGALLSPPEWITGVFQQITACFSHVVSLFLSVYDLRAGSLAQDGAWNSACLVSWLIKRKEKVFSVMLLELKVHLSFGLHRRIGVEVFQRSKSLGFFSACGALGVIFHPACPLPLVDAVTSIPPALWMHTKTCSCCS